MNHLAAACRADDQLCVAHSMLLCYDVRTTKSKLTEGMEDSKRLENCSCKIRSTPNAHSKEVIQDITGRHSRDQPQNASWKKLVEQKNRLTIETKPNKLDTNSLIDTIIIDTVTDAAYWNNNTTIRSTTTNKVR